MSISRLLCSPSILCQISNRFKSSCACDAGFLCFTPFTRLENAQTMRKAWSGCERAEEVKRRRRRASLFCHSEFVRVTAALQAMSLFGLGRWGRPLTILAAHLYCVSHFFFFFFYFFFLCFSCVFYKVGRNSRHKVSSRHMMQMTILSFTHGTS